MILDPCCNWVAHGSRQGVVLRLCDESKSEALVLAGGSVLPISVENNAMYPHHHTYILHPKFRGYCCGATGGMESIITLVEGKYGA